MLAGAVAVGLVAMESPAVPAADASAVAVGATLGRHVDFGVRHLTPAASAVGGRSVDYGVRHLTPAVETSDSLRDDYGTRHLAG